MQQLRKHWFHIVSFLFIMFLFVWGCHSDPVTSATDKESFTLFCEGWSQRVDGEFVPLDNICDFYPMPEGEPLVFSCVIPEINEPKAILFYSDNQEVRCYIGHELVQHFAIQKDFSVLKTPGSAWNQIDVSVDMGGQSCYLVLSSPVEVRNNRVNELYFIDPVDVGSARLEHLMFHILTALFLAALIIISAINSIMWKNQQRKKYFVALTHMYWVVFVYLIAGLQVFEWFFGRPILSHIIAEFCLRAMPYCVWRLALNSTDRYIHPHMGRALGVLAKVNFVLPWVLLFGFGVSLLETQWMAVFTIIIMMAGFFGIILEKWIHFRTLDWEEYPCLPLIFLYIGALADVVSVFCSRGITSWTGVFSVVACVIYTISVYIIFISIDVRTAQQKAAIEKSYQKLQVTTLMQQIKAHFIFNTLNTISALCKENTSGAEDAIRAFATYLRSYMYITNHQGDIHFTEELRLVQAYLTIERMRFGDQVDYQLEIEYDSFHLPSLIVQTLVENAVNHGIRGQHKAGKVVVSSRKMGKTVEISVADSGIGFDVNVPYGENCRGLLNVKRRLEHIEGSQFTIESRQGVGTKITIILPILDINSQEYTL